MKHRIPTRAMAAAAVPLLLAGAAAAAAADPRPAGGSPMKIQCLAMDLQVVQTRRGVEARMEVRWDCPKTPLQADLSIEVMGYPVAQGRMEGASQIALTAPLRPAESPGRFEVCGRVEGEKMLGKTAVSVDGSECHTITLPAQIGEPRR